MSVSAIHMRTPRGTMISRRRQARRFWSAMAVALRETGNPTGEAPIEENKNFAARGTSYDASWRLPAAA